MVFLIKNIIFIDIMVEVEVLNSLEEFIILGRMVWWNVMVDILDFKYVFTSIAGLDLDMLFFKCLGNE